MKAYPVLVLVLGFSASLLGQKDRYADEARALSAAGKVEKNTYINQHAGFLIHLPRAACKPEVHDNLSLAAAGAILLSCVHEAAGGSTYTLNVLLDIWSRYANMTETAQYVRGLHRLGLQDPNDRSRPDPNAKTAEPETPKKWAGMDFVEVIMNMNRTDPPHYIGVTCTHFKDYVLCIRAEGRSLELVQALLKMDGKLELTNQPAGKTATH